MTFSWRFQSKSSQRHWQSFGIVQELVQHARSCYCWLAQWIGFDSCKLVSAVQNWTEGVHQTAANKQAELKVSRLWNMKLFLHMASILATVLVSQFADRSDKHRRSDWRVSDQTVRVPCKSTWSTAFEGVEAALDTDAVRLGPSCSCRHQFLCLCTSRSWSRKSKEDNIDILMSWSVR